MRPGGALPGVTVDVTSPSLIEKVRSTTTDNNGRIRLPRCPSAHTEVRFALRASPLLCVGKST